MEVQEAAAVSTVPRFEEQTENAQRGLRAREGRVCEGAVRERAGGGKGVGVQQGEEGRVLQGELRGGEWEHCAEG